MKRRDFAAGFGVAAGAVSLVAAQSAPAAAQGASESTWDQIHRTGVLRVGVIAAQEPAFHKDPATGEWSGSMLSMSRDIANTLGVKLGLLETTYGNSILDLQANKIDVGLALQATPKRAEVINFTRPVYNTQFSAILRKGFDAKSWDELNKPGVRIAVDRGSIFEFITQHFAPKAQVIGLPDIQAVDMALIAGRADAQLSSWLDSIVALKRNPQLGTLMVLPASLSMGVYFGTRYEPDQHLVQFLNAWGDYNRQIGQIRQWIIDSLAVFNLTADDIPAEVKF